MNGVEWQLVVTKLDVLDDLAEIPICVGYEIDGKVTDEIPCIQFFAPKQQASRRSVSHPWRNWFRGKLQPYFVKLTNCDAVLSVPPGFFRLGTLLLSFRALIRMCKPLF